MALSSPALTVANEVLFGDIRPVIDLFRKLGPTDFTDGKPEVATKPGATVKIPWSGLDTALEFDDSTNNYLTAGDTTWVACTATHYKQGFDIRGVNLDQGVDAPKMKNLFTFRASKGIAMAIQGSLKTALDGTTVSTAVTLPAAGTATIADYLGIASDVSWLNKATCALCVNGTELAAIKAKFAAANIVASNDQIAEFLGVKSLIYVPGMTARAVLVPNGSIGFLGRVPAIIANYQETGVETDSETGLSVGIVVANDQALNRIVVNADMWFGTLACSASANASTTKGIIKVGTAE